LPFFEIKMNQSIQNMLLHENQIQKFRVKMSSLKLHGMFDFKDTIAYRISFNEMQKLRFKFNPRENKDLQVDYDLLFKSQEIENLFFIYEKKVFQKRSPYNCLYFNSLLTEESHYILILID
jgi:hypothetical protein